MTVTSSVTEGTPKKHLAFRLIQQIPPGVVHILADERTARAADTRHVALQVLAEYILLSAVLKPRNAALVVEIPLDLTIGLFINDPLAVLSPRI